MPAWMLNQWSLVGVFLMLTAGAAGGDREDGWAAVAGDETPAIHSQLTFHYRMKGKIRPLLFWIGRDDVGGGRISLLRAPGAENARAEGVEVLFGSIPERVPGGINRWGYAREWAYWDEKPDSPEQETLKHTAFTGLMRLSDEDSISDVRARDSQEKTEERFWYEASESRVFGDAATAELRRFSETLNFDFREPDFILEDYRQRVRRQEPDERREADNRHRYPEPYGFLTAVRQTVWEIITASHEEPARWRKGRPEKTYIHNTKPYFIRVTGVDHHHEFSVQRKDSRKEKVFRSVAEVRFRTKDPRDGDTHDFKIWFPLRGPLRGIPLKIEDMPRWWLHIELNLLYDEKMAERAARLGSFGPLG